MTSDVAAPGVDDPALHLPVVLPPAEPPSRIPDGLTLSEVAFFEAGRRSYAIGAAAGLSSEIEPARRPEPSFRRWARLRWLRTARWLVHLLAGGPPELSCLPYPEPQPEPEETLDVR